VRSKLATPVALLAAVAVFFGVFVFTHSLLWSPILAIGTAVGVYLMLDDRSRHQVESDNYVEDAHRKVSEAMRVTREILRLSREVAAPAARNALESACHYVPELFDRVRATSPNSLYSSASQMAGHLTSLQGAVTQYLDIQRKPHLYADPQGLMKSGEAAFQRFAEFSLESVRLVSQGDIATYKANLETVAPPKLPELG
jgi:hypothetical protein